MAGLETGANRCKQSTPQRQTAGQRQSDHTRKQSVNQSVAPGTALTAYLKRYRFDLLELPPDRHISQLVDCVDCLLLEAEQVRAA